MPLEVIETPTCGLCKHWFKKAVHSKQAIAGLGNATSLTPTATGECREQAHLMDEPVVVGRDPLSGQPQMALKRHLVYGPCNEDFPACGRFARRPEVPKI